MKNKEIALCDLDTGYITMFASYLMEHIEGVGIHIFTTPESFFVDETEYDLGILTPDFEEVSSFRQSKTMKKKYILCENSEERSYENGIYKYQSMDDILREIPELVGIKEKKASTKNLENKSKFIGVYSPISHELQMPFSLALSNSLKDKGNVLFLDLEEISILPSLIGCEIDRNLMDLLYELSTENENLILEDYIHHFMGMDYIIPCLNPDELPGIDEETWERLFKVLENSGYDTIVVLFGRAINGFGKILSAMKTTYVLSKPGDYFKKGQNAFLEYLNRLETDSKVNSVMLPMSAANLTDGAYCLEELLQGNLGVFVRKLLGQDERIEQVSYA